MKFSNHEMVALATENVMKIAGKDGFLPVSR